jgi:hypothetical protein
VPSLLPLPMDNRLLSFLATLVPMFSDCSASGLVVISLADILNEFFDGIGA